jgi:hypothetical protein
MWYNYNYTCCYKNNDIFTPEESAILDSREKHFVQDALYRSDLLNIFYLEDFIEEKLNSLMYKVWEFIKDDSYMLHQMKKTKTDEPLTALMILFSFDYLNETHTYLSSKFH